jgi:hypothetical protein
LLSSPLVPTCFLFNSIGANFESSFSCLSLISYDMANNDVPNESTGLLRIVKVREDSGVQGLLPRLLQKDIVLCMMVYFFHQMQGFLPIGPYLLLYERSICYTYYSAHDSSLIGPGGKIDELLCKVVPVQHELAVVRAWEGAFAAIPGLSLST